MPPPLPTLPDELLEEIFLRIRLHQRPTLSRAKLASKFWGGLLTSPDFRRRYRERHGDPPKPRGGPGRSFLRRALYEEAERQKKLDKKIEATFAKYRAQDAAKRQRLENQIAEADAARKSEKYHLQETTKHVAVEQAPSRSTLTKHAAQPVSLASLRPMAREIDRNLADINSKLYAPLRFYEAQREGKPM